MSRQNIVREGSSGVSGTYLAWRRTLDERSERLFCRHDRRKLLRVMIPMSGWSRVVHSHNVWGNVVELRLELLVVLGVWLPIEGSNRRGSEQGYASSRYDFMFKCSFHHNLLKAFTPGYLFHATVC